MLGIGERFQSRENKDMPSYLKASPLGVWTGQAAFHSRLSASLRPSATDTLWLRSVSAPGQLPFGQACLLPNFNYTINLLLCTWTIVFSAAAPIHTFVTCVWGVKIAMKCAADRKDCDLSAVQKTHTNGGFPVLHSVNLG